MNNKYSEPGICELCGEERKNILHHHLSYKPEIIVHLCHYCHSSIHKIAWLSHEQRDKVIQWIIKYGDQWPRGFCMKDKSSYNKNWAQRCVKENREKARRWYKNNLEKARIIGRKSRERSKSILPLGL